jgi:hypothetical protein
LGLIKVGNQAKPLKYPEKKKSCISTNLEEMFKRKATDRDTQPTTKRRATFALKNARLLPDDSCCLSDKGNEIPSEFSHRQLK